jgi:hypothetical protein
VRRGSAVVRRSLPIRRPPEEVRRLWQDPEARRAVLDGIPAADAHLELGAEDRDFGWTVTLELRLDPPLPAPAGPALAGKAVRRLKALAETGEVPTTDHNPSARPDAGEEAR